MAEAAPWQGTRHESIPTKGPRAAFQPQMLQLRNHHRRRALPTPHRQPAKATPSTNASSPLVSFGLSHALCHALSPLFRKWEFHSRELLRYHRQRCQPPPPQTGFVGAKRASVILYNCNRYLGKRLAPGVRTCFSRRFPIKTEVPGKLWVRARARDSDFKLLCTRALPNSRRAVTGYSQHENPFLRLHL